MTKRDELAALLPYLPDEIVNEWLAQAARLRVTMALPGDDALASDTKAWLDASASDMLAALDELEAGVPQADKDAWHAAMMKNAVAVRFDPATGDVVEA